MRSINILTSCLLATFFLASAVSTYASTPIPSGIGI